MTAHRAMPVWACQGRMALAPGCHARQGARAALVGKGRCALDGGLPGRCGPACIRRGGFPSSDFGPASGSRSSSAGINRIKFVGFAAWPMQRMDRLASQCISTPRSRAQY